MPYRQISVMKPGDHWAAAPTTQQFEHYVEIDGEVMPVGAAIARDLLMDGAAWVCFTELWGRRPVVVSPDLVAQEMDGRVGVLLSDLRAANDGRFGGLPDVIGEWADGTVVMREAKKKSKDRLSVNQHKFARAARRVLGDRLDLAVVVWTPINDPDWPLV